MVQLGDIMEVGNDKLDKQINENYKNGKSYAEWQKERYKNLYRVEHYEFRVPRSVEENRYRKDSE